MSFSKETDVKNRLSRRIRKNILPLPVGAKSDFAGYSGEEQDYSSVRISDIISPRVENWVGFPVVRKSQA
jgi:hypothetical protein